MTRTWTISMGRFSWLLKRPSKVERSQMNSAPAMQHRQKIGSYSKKRLTLKIKVDVFEDTVASSLPCCLKMNEFSSLVLQAVETPSSFSLSANLSSISNARHQLSNLHF